MPEPLFLVVATSESTADALLGTVPPDAPVRVALLGVAAADLSEAVRRLPCDEIHAVPGVRADAEVDAAAAALVELAGSARVVLMDSSQASRDLAGVWTIALDRPIVWAIDALRLVTDGLEADRVVLGGSHRLVHQVDLEPGVIVLAKPTMPASLQGRPSRDVDVTESNVDAGISRVRVLEAAEGESDGVPLNAARVVVSVGRGIGGPENVELFRDLALVAGAGLGASRVAVDSGWIPFSHQVGQTGTAIAPDLYVAFGISGAIQHLAGMRGSKRVIAVNTDLEAPLCQMADVVIQADAVAVARAVVARLDAG